jgi:PAS domain-containing protein
MKEWRLRGITADRAVTQRAGVESPLDPVRAMLQRFPGLFWTTDRTHTVTSCLGRTLGSIGVAPNQLVGTEVGRLFEPEDALVLEAHARALQGETVSFTAPVAGRLLHARVAPLVDEEGRTLGVIGLGVEAARTARPAELLAAAG